MIIDQLGAFLVLPNKLSLTLSDVVAPITIKISEPAVRIVKFSSEAVLLIIFH